MRLALAIAAASSLLAAPRAHAIGDLAAGPLQVEFRVDTQDHGTPLASGSMDLEPFTATRFETKGVAKASRLKLEILARPQKDGTVAVEVGLDEAGANGQEIKWETAVQGKRGVPLAATIHAGETTRTITVTVK